jgi:hypothetical protein
MRGNLARRTVICLVLTIGLLGAVMLATLVVAGDSASAQAGSSTWARTYHGDDSVFGKGILRMPDGDLVVMGTLAGRLLVTRLSPDGDVRWSKTYDRDVVGGVSDHIAPYGVPCSPSGMLVCWERTLFRLNDSGTVRWTRNYGIHAPSDSLRTTEFSDIVQLADGGFVTCGRKGGYQVFVCRLGANGTPVWSKSYALGSAERPRVFSLAGGGFLLGGTTPDDELNEGTQGVKLMWLTADGKVQRSQAYYYETEFPSSYGQLTTMAMTSGGPVLCQQRYSVGCFGANVIMIDLTGAVQWTTWVGGLRRGSADARLSGIDVAPDGSLLLVGATTEFSEHTDWGYDGMAEKLSPGGAVEWVTTVDREVFTATDSPQPVVAMDDGGLAWASTSHRNGTDDWDAFVIRMGPGGTAGKLGSYQTQVDIGNARLVRIEHPVMTTLAASRDSQSVECEFEEADADPQDTTLTGSDVEGEALSTLTLQPLYPANAATPSSIMQGGTMYRYYRVVDANGDPVEGAEFRYYGPFRNTALTATSDGTGEIAFSFVVPRSTEPEHLDSTLSIDRVRVNGRRSTLASAPDFATDVLPLSWSTNWMLGNGIAGKVGLGVGGGVFAAGQQMSGMVLTRTEADPANDGDGSMTVADSLSGEAAIGVQGEAGKMRLGTVQAKAVDASAKASLGTFIDFATLFDQPSECSTTEKLMAALTLLVGVEQTASGGATTLLSVAESAIVSALDEDVDMEHLTGGVSAGISGDVSALALELSKKGEAAAGSTESRSLTGVSFAKLGEGERALLSITGYPGAGELSGKAALELSLSASFVEAFGYQVAGWSGTDAVSAELVVDPLATSLERLVLTAVAPADDRGESQETRLTIDRSVVGAAADAALAQVLPLAPVMMSQPGQRIFFTKEFCGQVLQNVALAVASVTVPYEHVVTKDKNPTSLEVGIGVSIGGTGVDLAIKPTWGRYQSFPVERGLFVALDDQLHIGRMVKLEEYPASLFSSQVDTLPDVTVELLKVVGELLSQVWDLVTGTLSSAKDTLLEVGAGAGSAFAGGATVLFEKGTGISLSSLGSISDTQLALLAPRAASDTGPLSDTRPALIAASSTKRVTLVGAPSDGGGLFVGGVYALEPENGALSKPATLTLSYSAEAAGARDPATFSIYHYDATGRVWTPVDSAHDRAARTLTAAITEMGGYCIGSDSGAPEFALLLPSGTPAVVTAPKPQLTVGCVEDGSGLESSTFKATLDEQPLQAEWSPAAGCAVLTVENPLASGTHTLAVEGADGTGNRGSATFEIEVRLPPGQAVLRLKEVTSEQVDLQLEAGPGDSSPAAYDVWRTDPGPGVTYRHLKTVTPDSGEYSDTDVLPGETYRYVAVALSEEDVEGPASEPLTVTVLGDSTSETTATTTATATAETTSGTTTVTATGAESGQDGLSGSTWLAIIGSAVAAAALAVLGVLVVRLRRRR